MSGDDRALTWPEWRRAVRREAKLTALRTADEVLAAWDGMRPQARVTTGAWTRELFRRARVDDDLEAVRRLAQRIRCRVQREVAR